MADHDAFVRALAAWALVHESADEGWKAAVERGSSQQPGAMDAGPEGFVDGLAALVAKEKERLKAELSSGESGAAPSGADVGRALDELRFEVSELRGRIESLQASVDALCDEEG
jgi:hypothetical protein